MVSGPRRARRRAPRAPPCTRTGSTSCARTRRRTSATGAVAAAEAVRETWRALEEFNLNPSLALEALFVRLRRELSGVHARASTI